MINRSLCAALAVALTASLSLSRPVSAQTPDLYDIETVRDIYLTFSQANYWQQLLNNYAPEINLPADMRVDGVTYPNVGVRFRGNTSYFSLPANSEKKSFNIETDAFVAGQDLYGYEHINLNNGFHDPTFLREFILYWAMRQHGAAPKCNFVKLWLNNVYWGVYINVQQPNKDMMRDWFRSNDGNRYRGFPTSGGFSNGRTALTWLGSTVSLYLSAYQAKQGDGTDLMQMINVLNNTPAAQIEALLPAEFSVDNFYRYAAVMNVGGNTDSYIGSGKDHFLYHDPVHGAFHMFPFDMNEGVTGATTLDPWYQTTTTTKPAFTKTFVVPAWRERYKSHVRQIVETTFNAAVLHPMLTRFHNLLTPMVTADTKKIYSTTLFLQNLTQTVSLGGIGGTSQPGLLPWVTGREAYLRAHADLSAPRTTLSALAHTPVSPTPQQPVNVTVAATNHASTVKLWWRKLGPFASTPMFDDGLHGDGGANDGVWGASIPAQTPGSLVDYYVEAATATNLQTCLPYGAEFNARQFMVRWPTGISPIRLNEFVAQNVTGIVDENNQHEDWLELYNDSGAAVNVGGMWVTDDFSQPKFQIPANTMIAANGTLLIWCDEDGTQGPLHANFKLSSGGEHLALFAPDAQTLLDDYEYGLQVADVANGRLYDGGTPWVSFTVPSPRLRNQLATCGTRTYGWVDSRAHSSRLSLTGSTQIGATPTLALANGPASGLGALFLSTGAATIDLTPFALNGEFLLLNPGAMFGPLYLPLDGQGAVSIGFPIPGAQNLVNLRLYLQMISAGAIIDASNAVELVVCP
jgi:hypothetical protein